MNKKVVIRISVIHILLLISLLLQKSGDLRAQETQTQLMNSVVPMAPNAASLAKYADVPVSYYTGTPTITVPIYAIKQGDLSLPISLNYHASGIRVDDIAPWVGLGWSLNAGGLISRTIRGLADETETYGFFAMGNTINDENASALNYHYLYNVVYRNVYDSEPDLYFINLPTGSIKFTFDTNQNPVLQNYEQIKIERFSSTQSEGQQWKVTIADGTQYLFGQKTIESEIYGGIDASTMMPEGKSPVTGPSSWYLYKITSADGVDAIYFKYENEDNFTYDLNLEETYSQRDVGAISANPIFINCQEIMPKPSSPGTMIVNQRLLTKIKFDLGSVEFVPEGGRYDIQASRLAQINIKDKAGNIVKYYQLDHSYFGSTGNKRLKLNKLVEFSSSNKSLPPYEFKYDETNPLPARGSFDQDHWGFYNNNNRDSFIPQRIDKGDGTFLYYSDGGNRETDANLVKSCVLTRIMYPTGGYDQFEYEAHDFASYSQQTAIEYYDEVIQYNSKATASNNDLWVTGDFTLDKSYSADVEYSTACRGTCDTPGSTQTACERAAASILFSGPSVVGFGGGSCLSSGQTYHVTLAPGQYHVELHSEYFTSEMFSQAGFKLTLHKSREITTSSQKQYVGGVRVSRIQRSDGMGSPAKVNRFVYKSSDTGLSSGVLVRKPFYYFRMIAETGVDGGTLACPYEAGYSSSKVPLGEGTHIGYSEVKVLEGDNGENGYQIFKFTTALDNPDTDLNGNMFPFPPAQSHDSRRGLLKEKWIHDKEGHPLTATFNHYTQRPDKYKKIAEGLKVAIWIQRQQEIIIQPSSPDYDKFLRDFGVRYYKFLQEWQYLDNVTERVYSQAHDGTFTDKVTTYSYDRPDNHVQLTQQDQNLQDGTILRTKYKYPQDYTTGGNLTNINALTNAFVLSAPVEVQAWRIRNGASELLTSRITDYHPQFFKPVKIWLLESASPLTSLNNEVLTNQKYTDLFSDNEKFVSRAQFDYSLGRLTNQYKTNDVPQSFLWGYNSSQLIAEMKNALPGQWHYEGFEENGDSDPGDAKTGTRSKLNGYNKELIDLTAGNFVLSYWIKQNGIWSFQSQPVSVSGTSYSISLGGQVDDIRFYPQGAQMTSYTYDPFIGVTSITDFNNQIVYYTYDSFGRLETIKDHSGHFVKRYEYNYQIR